MSFVIGPFFPDAQLIALSHIVYKMQSYAKANGLTEFISMQDLHNPIYREEEREMMPMLKDLGVGVIPWSPLAGGFLARPLDDEGIKTSRQSVDRCVCYAFLFTGHCIMIYVCCVVS